MFSGSLVAIVTPMRPDGAVDHAAWEGLLDLHLQNGTSGIVVGGTTGESPTLTDAELFELLRRARAHCGNRVALIAGTGSNSTVHAVERVKKLGALQLDGLLVVTPAYNRPTQEGLYRHFAAIAQAAAAPIILYNVPGRTCVDLLPATVERLMKLPGIRAIKEAQGTVERIREIVALAGPDFDVLSGDDLTARESVLAGARGVISVTANVLPHAMTRLMALAARGERAQAEQLDAQLLPLHRALFVEANPIPVKWALKELNLIAEGIRLPLTWLSGSLQPQVRAALRAAQAGTTTQAGAA